MFIPMWLIVLVMTLWIGIPLTQFLTRRFFTDQPLNFHRYSEEEARAFLLDQFSIERTSPFAVQQFLNQHKIHFLYVTERNLIAHLENVDSYISFSVPTAPPTKHPRYWAFYWEFQIRFDFSKYKLVDIAVIRYSAGYDLVGW